MKIENDMIQNALEAIKEAERFILIVSNKNKEGGEIISKNANVNLAINAAYQILKNISEK